MGVAVPKNVCNLGVNDKFQSCAAYSSRGVGRTAALHGKAEVILLELPSRSPLGRNRAPGGHSARVDQTGNSCRIHCRMDVSASQLLNCDKANVVAYLTTSPRLTQPIVFKPSTPPCCRSPFHGCAQSFVDGRLPPWEQDGDRDGNHDCILPPPPRLNLLAKRIPGILGGRGPEVCAKVQRLTTADM